MHPQQRDIEKAIEESAYGFSFDRAIDKPKKYAQKEVEKPWLKWSVSQKRFKAEAAIPEWRKRLKIIFTQLTISMS